MADDECLKVRMFLEGKVLEFAGTCKVPHLCSYREFKAHVDSIWWPGWDHATSTWEEECKLPEDTEPWQ